MQKSGAKVQHLKRLIYCKDIFILSLTSFGGPGSHLTVFINRMVEKKKYLSEKEFLDIYSFCQMLPGPTSTQTITAMGYKFGGPWLAFLTLIIWIIPSCLLMATLAVGFNYYRSNNFSLSFLRYLHPMAVGFILAAAIKVFYIIKKKKLNIYLYFGAALLAAFEPLGPYVFPIILLAAGIISSYAQKPAEKYEKPKIKIRWRNFTYFICVFIAAVAVSGSVKYIEGIDEARPLLIFENSYRFGSIVFGGGNVLIPMMYEQFVQFRHYMSSEEFLTGVGFVQALPGPVFSLSSYTGGMILKDWGIHWQFIGSLIGSVAIFLPGALFIMFLYPIWDQVKRHPIITRAFDGIAAASAGLILAAAYLLSKGVGYEWHNLAVIGGTVLLLMFTKIPSPFIVIFTLLLGFVF